MNSTIYVTLFSLTTNISQLLMASSILRICSWSVLCTWLDHSWCISRCSFYLFCVYIVHNVLFCSHSDKVQQAGVEVFFDVCYTNQFLPELLKKDSAPVLWLWFIIRVQRYPNDERIQCTDVNDVVKYCRGPPSGHPFAGVCLQHLISGIDPTFCGIIIQNHEWFFAWMQIVDLWLGNGYACCSATQQLSLS